MGATPLTLAELDAAIERQQLGQTLAEQAEEWSGSLRRFLEHAWTDALGIRDPFVPGWHIDAICEHLEAVTAGEIRRLAITIPPGTTKSTITSICWPAWEWTQAPHRRHITASYAQRLATRLAVASRGLIQSGWYQARWGETFRLKADENLKTEFANDKTGRRLAISTGTGTGEHADVIIIDDPHDAEQALSDALRETASSWHDGTISTRFVDSSKGAEVIIMQRLHERDLVGHVLALEPGDWTTLCLPEEYEPRHPLVTPKRVALPSGREIAGDPRDEAGALLCPQRIDRDEHERRKLRMGSYRAAGQLQQRPTAREGEILKRAYWQFFPAAWLEDDRLVNLPRFDGLVQSWDTAFKDRTANDFVAGTLWGQVGPRLYLLSSHVERMSLSKTKAAIEAMTMWADKRFDPKKTPHRILIEKSANGVEIISELRRELRGVIPVTASTSKIARAEAAEPALEGKSIFVPGARDEDRPEGYDPALTPAFTQSLIEQAATFPHGEHDDEVDSLTQVINWTRRRPKRKPSSFGRPRGGLPAPSGFVRV